MRSRLTLTEMRGDETSVDERTAKQLADVQTLAVHVDLDVLASNEMWR